jgi:D-alanyl-D-alanine carboxypeptidase/D-alanyl-D-alanine-endopeptidase (penicillin-binding protein 4)
VDEGRAADGLTYDDHDPAAAAADFFAAELRRRGIRVVGQPVRGRRGDESVVARVRSAPLSQIVEHTLEVSDNNAAEVLARQVAVTSGRPASFSGGTLAVRRVLAGLGVDTSRDRVYDGSGLSRQDRVSPRTLLSVLSVAADSGHPRLRAVVTSLPVAGFTGSLAYRFQVGDPRALGTVRAKTGTLTGVHVLAGVATTPDGALMSFVAAADHVPFADNLDGQQLVDRMVAALGGCRCAATP